MKTTEKFTNGLSIIQLEERYEMVALARGREEQPSETESWPPEMFPNWPF